MRVIGLAPAGLRPADPDFLLLPPRRQDPHTHALAFVRDDAADAGASTAAAAARPIAAGAPAARAAARRAR